MQKNDSSIDTPWEAYVVDPPQQRVESKPATYEVVVETGLRIPMYDGTELAATLWRPKQVGRYPALVERAPHRLEERTGPAGAYYAARGYAVLGVGLRGCSGSGGTFTGNIPGTPTGDGYDTIEWTAIQPWCNGQVGMICGSISGFTQYQTAVEAPPHLVSLLVREGPFSGSLGMGGTIPLLMLQAVASSWTENQLEYCPSDLSDQAHRLVQSWQQDWQAAAESAEPGSPFAPIPEMTKRLPLYPHPLFQGVADYYNDWLVPPQTAEGQQSVGSEGKVGQVQIPICHLGGWFDGIVRDTLAAFTSMQQRAATPEARQAQRLIIGPWVHGPMYTHDEPVGLLEFGPNAKLDFFAFRQRWYDAHLQGKGDLTQDPIVWLYLMGADAWLGFDTWPPPQTKAIPWYLHTDQLSETPPQSAQNPDAYTYEPDDPILSLAGGGFMGMGMDNRPLEDRVLAYTSPPLEQPLTLLGPLSTTLHAASSAKDTDWVVRLTMVRPDGASIILSAGALRARYRHGRDQEELLEPGRPEQFNIQMMPLSIVVPVGHRLRLTVTSSDFPAIDRNLNTGGPIGQEESGQPASNQIYHDSQHPSHILLPVLNGPNTQ